MLDTDFSKYTVDLRHTATPKIGLSRLDAAKSGPLPRLTRTSESSVRPCYKNYRRDENFYFAVGSLLAKDRKTNLVRLLTKNWKEFEGVAGFTHNNFDGGVTQTWTRGAVVLQIENVCPGDRGKKVFATDFNNFSLDESAGGFLLGIVKRVEVTEAGNVWACVAFSCLGEEPIEAHDLTLMGYADVKM